MAHFLDIGNCTPGDLIFPFKICKAAIATGRDGFRHRSVWSSPKQTILESICFFSFNSYPNLWYITIMVFVIRFQGPFTKDLSNICAGVARFEHQLFYFIKQVQFYNLSHNISARNRATRSTDNFLCHGGRRTG
jgi:hypothetical protein